MNNNDTNSLRSRLLARHTAAEPQLDQIRHTVLAATLAPHAAENALVPTSQLLRALFLPDRHVWTALAATWVLLAALQLVRPDSASTQSPLAATDPQLAPALEFSPSPARLATSLTFADRQAQLHALLR